MDSLGEILRRLHQSKVQFVIIGGLAAVKHGTSYVTYDVDICVPKDAGNFKLIAEAIRDLNPRFRQRRDLPFELTPERLNGLNNLYLLTDLGPLDCLGDVAAIGDFDAVVQESELAKFPFGECRMLKIGALIRAKEAIGRPQDHFVTTQLRAIQERIEAQKKQQN
ncbi:MAG TPA: hypothetical protein VF773_05630 [Verrucomicrobiae bacterium]